MNGDEIATKKLPLTYHALSVDALDFLELQEKLMPHIVYMGIDMVYIGRSLEIVCQKKVNP